jgi:hypothetical protein
MPSVRSKLNINRIPSKDIDAIEPVEIASNFNFQKKSGIFIVDLSSLKSGKVNVQEKIFNLVATDDGSGKCAIAVGSIGKGENTLPAKIKGIPVNEDVSSLIFLHACALPSENQKAYFNIPDFFDTSDLLGWYEIVYEDEYTISVPVQYGVNILEWNPGGEDRLDKNEGETGSPQNVYCYYADPVLCSQENQVNPITFYAFEWINPRFGKKVKEVNICGSVNYQATQTNYGKPEYKPMKSNAIILTGLTKVKKTNPFVPNDMTSK